MKRSSEEAHWNRTHSAPRLPFIFAECLPNRGRLMEFVFCERLLSFINSDAAIMSMESQDFFFLTPGREPLWLGVFKIDGQFNAQFIVCSTHGAVRANMLLPKALYWINFLCKLNLPNAYTESSFKVCWKVALSLTHFFLSGRPIGRWLECWTSIDLWTERHWNTDSWLCQILHSRDLSAGHHPSHAAKPASIELIQTTLNEPDSKKAFRV